FFAHAQSQFQQSVIDWPQVLFLAGKHFFHIFLRGFQIIVRVAHFFAFTNRTLSEPPSRVGSQSVPSLEPFASLFFSRRSFLLNQLEPFVKRASGLLLELSHPLLRHRNA